MFGLVDVSAFVEYVTVMFGGNAGGYTAYGIRYYLSNQMLFYLAIALIACVPWKAVWKKAATDSRRISMEIPERAVVAVTLIRRVTTLV